MFQTYKMFLISYSRWREIVGKVLPIPKYVVNIWHIMDQINMTMLLVQLFSFKIKFDSFSWFQNLQFDDLSKITNLINKNKFNNLLDLKILEILNEERNKTKDSYQPSELEPKTQLGELDFLYTDQEERRLLLEQTNQLGNNLAIKF